ncbi:MAG: hypothetical protein WKF75_14105 [Singulisphaera sp.]
MASARPSVHSSSATTPATLQIFVFSNADADPDFNPVTDIDPTTIVINGVAFPDAIITEDLRRER